MHVPHADTSPRSILTSHRVKGISWNVQAPDTDLSIPRLLYQCHIYSFTTDHSSKNARSSSAMFQVSLNERNGTHHISFGLLLLFISSYFFPSGFEPRREKTAWPTPLKGLHPSSSSMVMDAVSILSTRRTPCGSSLKL